MLGLGMIHLLEGGECTFQTINCCGDHPPGKPRAVGIGDWEAQDGGAGHASATRLPYPAASGGLRPIAYLGPPCQVAGWLSLLPGGGVEYVQVYTEGGSRGLPSHRLRCVQAGEESSRSMGTQVRQPSRAPAAELQPVRLLVSVGSVAAGGPGCGGLGKVCREEGFFRFPGAEVLVREQGSHWDCSGGGVRWRQESRLEDSVFHRP